MMRPLLIVFILVAACSSAPDDLRFAAAKNSLVVLDARALVPDELDYEWRLVEKPAASSAKLEDASTVSPRFLADAGGEYRLELVVGSGVSRARTPGIVVEVVNSAPLASALDEGLDFLMAGLSSPIDASESSDDDGDELSFTWSIASGPAGATAEFLDLGAGRAAVEVSDPGDYVLEVVVSDGEDSSTAEIQFEATPFILETGTTLRGLAYSEALDLVLLVEGDSDLYLYSASTDVLSVISLPGFRRLAVSNDGLTAAFTHDTNISLIDLTTQQIVSTFDVGSIPLEIALASSERVFFRRNFPDASIYAVEVADGSIVMSTAATGVNSRLFAAPGQDAIYAVASGIARKWSATPPIDLITSGTEQIGALLWFSEDGSQAFTNSGVVFRASADPAQDHTVLGSLDGLTGVNSVSESAERGQALVVPFGLGGQMLLYDSATLMSVGAIPAPRIPIGTTLAVDTSVAVAFLTTDGTELRAIVSEGSFLGIYATELP